MSVENCIETLYLKRDNPDEITSSDLKNIPKSFLKYYYLKYLSRIWNLLPIHLQEDKELQQYLRCRRHPYNNGNVHYDGPPPRRIDCRICRNEN